MVEKRLLRQTCPDCHEIIGTVSGWTLGLESLGPPEYGNIT